MMPDVPTQVTDSFGRIHRASLNEYNVASALAELELKFMFQVEYFGGRRIRGGQVLDFLVYAPFASPLQVYGEYWHEGQMAAEDSYKLSILRVATGQEVDIIWGADSATFEDAMAAVQALYG